MLAVGSSLVAAPAGHRPSLIQGVPATLPHLSHASSQSTPLHHNSNSSAARSRRECRIPTSMIKGRGILLISTASGSTTLTWSDALDKTRGLASLATYQLMPQFKPSTVPTPTLPPLESSSTNKPVLLYRDTNAWCPYCARVMLALELKGIPYDSVLIDLRSKPEWYMKAVPTGLTPAARVNGQLLWESADILLHLEAQFPEQNPLLPVDMDAKLAVLDLMSALDDIMRPGFKYLTGSSGGSLMAGSAAVAGSTEDEAALRREFEEEGLAVLEAVLARSGGPFMMGQLSLVDVMLAPNMERQAAFLAEARHYDMRHNPRFPHLASWFQALEALPAYQAVRCDDYTLQLLMKRIFGYGRNNSSAAATATSSSGSTAISQPTDNPSKDTLEGVSTTPAASVSVGAISPHIATATDPAAVAAAAAAADLARKEAAAKLALNHEIVVADIIKNSGLGAFARRLAAPVTSGYVQNRPAMGGGMSAAASAAPAPLSQPAPTIVSALSSAAAAVGLKRPVEKIAAAYGSMKNAGNSQPTDGSNGNGNNGNSSSSNGRSSADAAAVARSPAQAATGASSGPSLPPQAQATPTDPVLLATVDDAMRRVATCLLGGGAGQPYPPDAREKAAISAAAVAFFHNRASAPRDMSAAAVTELRAACLTVLKELY